MNHKKSTITLFLLFGIMIISVVSSIFTTQDVDELCNTEGAVLSRNETEWYCRTGSYIEVWGKDIGEVSIASTNVYYNVTNLTTGENSSMTHEAGIINVLSTGLYQITSQYSFSGTPNNEYHIKLHRNGVGLDKCNAERVIGNGGDVGSASITCFQSLTAGDFITIAIENIDSTGNPTIHSINLNMRRTTG